MKKFWTIICFSVFVVSVWGRPYYGESHSAGSSFEIGVGAGYGSLGYGVENSALLDSKVSGSWSGTAHVGYNYFFVEWVGIGVGVDFTRFGSTMQLDGSMIWNGVGDTDGEKYNHTLALAPWHELQQVYYLEPALSITFSVPAGSVYVIGELGAKYGMAMISDYVGSGTLTHTGYYEPWDLTLSDVDSHGFYTTKDYQPSDAFAKPNNKISAFAKLGVAIPLIEHLDLTIQAYGQYAFTSSKVGGDKIPGYVEDKVGMKDAHYFMESYNTWLFSPLAKDGIRPWMGGVEIGIRYTIPHGKHSACPCHWVE